MCRRQFALLACAVVAAACGGRRATGTQPPSGAGATAPGANAAGGRLCPCLADRPPARLRVETADDTAVLVLDGAALGSAALEDDGLPLAPGPHRLEARIGSQVVVEPFLGAPGCVHTLSLRAGDPAAGTAPDWDESLECPDGVAALAAIPIADPLRPVPDPSDDTAVAAWLDDCAAITDRIVSTIDVALESAQDAEDVEVAQALSDKQQIARTLRDELAEVRDAGARGFTSTMGMLSMARAVCERSAALAAEAAQCMAVDCWCPDWSPEQAWGLRLELKIVHAEDELAGVRPIAATYRLDGRVVLALEEGGLCDGRIADSANAVGLVVPGEHVLAVDIVLAPAMCTPYGYDYLLRVEAQHRFTAEGSRSLVLTSTLALPFDPQADVPPVEVRFELRPVEAAAAPEPAPLAGQTPADRP
jgi:hypothetical protein